jgi:hypothetical protein
MDGRPKKMILFFWPGQGPGMAHSWKIKEIERIYMIL